MLKDSPSLVTKGRPHDNKTKGDQDGLTAHVPVKGLYTNTQLLTKYRL